MISREPFAPHGTYSVCTEGMKRGEVAVNPANNKQVKITPKGYHWFDIFRKNGI